MGNILREVDIGLDIDTVPSGRASTIPINFN